MDFKDAFVEDLFTLGRLIAVCFANVRALPHLHTNPVCLRRFVLTIVCLCLLVVKLSTASVDASANLRYVENSPSPSPPSFVPLFLCCALTCQWLGSQLTLQPKWRQAASASTPEGREVRCENGDPWDLIFTKINSWAIDQLEAGVNWLTKTGNDILQPVLRGISLGFYHGRPLPENICFQDPARPRKCDRWDFRWNYQQHWRACEDSRGGLDMLVRTSPLPSLVPLLDDFFACPQCYYQRVHTICTNDDYLADYNELFNKGFESISDLKSQFSEAFGSSYEFLDPTLVDLVEQAGISQISGPDLEGRKDICSTQAFASSLRLDQIVSRRTKRRASTAPRLLQKIR